MTDLNYFARHGAMTDPGRHAGRYDGLPDTLPDLVALVQGLLVHVFWAERSGLILPSERQAEVQLRSMERRLARTFELDPAPLAQTRPLERKIVGNCRDFSLTLASLLQARGVPARPRCGFAAYFLPDHFEDHWVCETWDAARARWVLVDAQLDPLQCDVLKVPFDPLDVPRDQFLTGGAAWSLCRSGQADPDRFGIFDMHGIDFVKGDFVRDVAALNKLELLPWDCWGFIEVNTTDLTSHDLSVLDHLAGLTSGDVPKFELVKDIYESDPRLRVNRAVHSYVDGGMQTVELA
jgi:hypothetical protein